MSDAHRADANRIQNEKEKFAQSKSQYVAEGQNNRRQRGNDDEKEREHLAANESDDDDVDMANVEGNLYQDDMNWMIKSVSNLCAMDDMAYYDENTLEKLAQHLVEEGDKAELARFKKIGVCSYVRRSEAVDDPDGTFVKVQWVRTNKGTLAQPNISCVVAQELDTGR